MEDNRGTSQTSEILIEPSMYNSEFRRDVGSASHASRNRLRRDYRYEMMMRGFSPTAAKRRFSPPSFPEERDRNRRNGVEVEAAEAKQARGLARLA